MNSTPTQAEIFTPIDSNKLQWYTEQEAPAGVPILDLVGLPEINPNDPNCRFLAEEMRKVLTLGSGFFYIKNFGLEEKFLEEFINITGEFYNSDPETRQKMVCDELPLRGFAELNSESTAAALKTGTAPDMCMKYTWTKDNVYPNEQFKKVWEKYQSSVSQIARKLVQLIRLALGEHNTQHHLWNQVIDGEAMIRHLYYPDIPYDSVSTGSDIERMAAHNDIGSVTVLYQTPCPNGFVSLEAKIDGNYVGIPAIRNTMVVNLGDILVHLTNHRLTAAHHRVLQSPTTGSERSSTILFYFPNGDFNLKSEDESHFQGLVEKDSEVNFSDFIKNMSAFYCHKKQ